MIIENPQIPVVDATPVVEQLESPPERELAEVLRESLEDVKSERVVSARQVLKDMAMRHNLPLEPGE